VLGVGTGELLVVLLVALVVLGPDKLPQAARRVGQVVSEVRKVSAGFQAELRDALQEPVEGAPAPNRSPTPKAPPPPEPSGGPEVVDGALRGLDEGRLDEVRRRQADDDVRPRPTGVEADPSSASPGAPDGRRTD
jgi:Tat protein translocase TatB subunit